MVRRLSVDFGCVLIVHRVGVVIINYNMSQLMVIGLPFAPSLQIYNIIL